MELDIYQVDAFSNQPFKGNPAAVVPLQSWLPDDLMQSIALENNLSETAFLVPQGQGYHIRWFTPAVEVPLCGHATLASAFVIAQFMAPGIGKIQFTSASGPLSVTLIKTGQGEQGFELDFPVSTYEPYDQLDKLETVLGVRPTQVVKGPKMLALFDAVAHFDSEDFVRNYQPDFAAIANLDTPSLIITATSKEPDVDFVSRLFAPKAGINEDPVTGSAHCLLAPFWSDRLGKTKMRSYQASARGGYMDCVLAGERVKLTGQACLYMQGKIFV